MGISPPYGLLATAMAGGAAVRHYRV